MIREVLSYNDDGSEGTVVYRHTEEEKAERERTYKKVLDILGHEPRNIEEAALATRIHQALLGIGREEAES